MASRGFRTRPETPPNQPRRSGGSLGEILGGADRRAREAANRPAGRRDGKQVRATIAESGPMFPSYAMEWPKRLLRWVLGLALMPLCWVTGWTFLSQFSHATIRMGFWQTAEFWYFATGIMLMFGWFASGLLQKAFLYLYVLGHELTHVVFVLLHFGKVTEFRVSTEGGYITTNRTNWLIALSPYFFPFWSVVVAIAYGVTAKFVEIPSPWDRIFFGAMGLTWTFHIAWTVWMILKDQPDLRESGIFLSLVLIILCNILVMSGLFCFAADEPGDRLISFGREWVRHAATWGDSFLRAMFQAGEGMRAWFEVRE